MPNRVNVKIEDLTSLERTSLLKFIQEAHALYVASLDEQKRVNGLVKPLSFEDWLNLLTEGIHEANQEFLKEHNK